MTKKLKNKKNPATDMCGGLDAKLFAYCAMAAGGALAAAPSADAAIAYSGLKNLTLADNNTMQLDLDSNGTADFSLVNLLGETAVTPGVVTYTTSQGDTYTQKFSASFVRRKTAKNFVSLADNPLNALAAAGANAQLRLGQGAVIPGQGIAWMVGAAAGLSFSTLTLTQQKVLRTIGTGATATTTTILSTFATDRAFGGTFLGKQAYLGVKFKIDNATHYGWIRYQGDTTPNTADNATSLKATVIDWAYEKLPDTPIAVGQQISNCVTLSPARISKIISIFEPLKTIIIKGDATTTLTKDTAIDWGTGGLQTLFKVPLGKSTLLAVVRVKPSLIKKGDTYEVTVDDCAANLTVGF
jgi:hypothetical protein